MRAEAWVLVAVTGALVVVAIALVVLLAVTLRLRGRLDSLESRVAEPAPPAAPPAPAVPAVAEPEFVITRVGETVETGEAAEPVPTVPAPVFADIVARESVIQAASLAAGLRRALSPETRHRIRFHVRQEVKRSRKQRKVELREVRREWAARQREGRAA